MSKAWALAHPEQVRAKSRKCETKKRAWIQNFKDQPCGDCKKKYPPYVMDFDHVPGRGEKFFAVNTLTIRKYGVEKLLAEMEKCDLVCSNCHRERTHQRAQRKASPPHQPA